MVMLALLQFCSALAQQKELKFRNFTQEDGLPSNEAYAVFRDSRDYIWMATDQGVVRFNGSRMEHFTLPDNVVFKIREDEQGRIWFFSHTGRLSYFLKEKIYPYRYNDSIAKYINGMLISDACITPEGGLKINSSGGDYSNYDISPEGHIQEFIYLTREKNYNTFSLIKTSPGSFFARRTTFNSFKEWRIEVRDEKGNIQNIYKSPAVSESFNHIGCTFDGKNIYFFAGRVLTRLNADGTLLTKKFPSDILCIQNAGENIWIGMIKNGAVLVNRNLKPLEDMHIFPGLGISSIMVDYEGGTWFSSLERGVFYLKNIQIYNLQGDEAIVQPISRMLNVNDSVLLFTNENGLYELTNKKVSHLLSEYNENVSDLVRNDKGTIFMACKPTNTKIHYTAKMVPINHSISNKVMVIQSSSEIYFPARNRIISLFGHLLRGYDPDMSTNDKGMYVPLFNHSIGKNGSDYQGVNVTMFFMDSKQQFWVSTLFKLFTLNKNLDSVTAFKPGSGIFQKGVTHMRQMKSGLYVIALRFGGVLLMKDTNIIGNITEDKGLLSNSVKYILPQDDKLWIATAKGISVVHFQSFDPLRYTITNIGKNDGLDNFNIKQLIAYQGNVLVATGNGIYVIEKPEVLLNRPPAQIPLYINKITYYKGDTLDVTSISVPYSNNRVKIGYDAISFNSTDELHYFYRLNKTDTTWQTITGTELLLENLSPGTYDLELKAEILSQRRFSQICKLTIIVKEPWWQNTWLKTGSLLLLILGGITFYKVRVKTITRKANLSAVQKTKMLELEQTALRSQMNPHFIFNSLTSIQQLILSYKAEQANEHLVKFARLIRKTLELSARPYIRISEEKEYLEEYLVLEQMRIPGEFEFRIETDERIDIFHTEIPNMMLQPIVENCIRHGIKHLEHRKGMITILLGLTGTVIRCTITDNGIGRDHSPANRSNIFFRQKSYGMEIVRKRLELLPGAEERNTIPEINDLYDKDGNPAGTKVSIELPYKIITND
ncbi:hypothetical protein EGI32_08185 [Ferruginibacter sp. HRS2-29]|nr:hypothetical protein [Ferruginibacter sp. HRS2-29]